MTNQPNQPNQPQPARRSILAGLAKKPINNVKSRIIIFTGDAGAGKTTAACTFPNAVALCAEDGMASVMPQHVPDCLPTLQERNDIGGKSLGVLDTIKEYSKLIIQEQHGYKTLIIDSISKLDSMFTDEIIANYNAINKGSEPVTSIGDAGGWGAGYQILESYHRTVMSLAMAAKNRGMNVVLICHSSLENLDLPDSEKYNRFGLQLSKGGKKVYLNDCDVCGFIRKRVMLQKEGRGEFTKSKVVGGAEASSARELVIEGGAVYDAKNRLPGAPNVLPFTKDAETGLFLNPLAKYL